MRTVTARRTIGAPIEKVWAVATDVERWPELIGGIEKVELLTDAPFGEGTRWRETRRMFGRAATEEMWVADIEPGRSYTVAADNQGVRYISTFTFTTAGAEHTVAVVTFTAQPRTKVARVLGTIAGAVAARGVAKTLQDDLNDLATAAETLT
nr:SRPBCC family protein [uncultured Friedmanniella sp.]